MPLVEARNKNSFPENKPEFTSDPQSLTLKGAISNGNLTNDLWIRNCEFSNERISGVPIELDFFLDSVERSEGLCEFITEKLYDLSEKTEAVNLINCEEERGKLTYDEVQDVLLELEDWPNSKIETSINLTCATMLFRWPNSTHALGIHEVSLDSVLEDNEREKKRAVLAFVALASREIIDGKSRKEAYFTNFLGLAPENRIR